MQVLDLLARTGDAGFAIDGAGRILDWNAAAERLFGFGRDEVIGRPCHQVLGCQDFLGRALCPDGCPLLQAVRLQRPPSAIDVLAHHRSGDSLEVSASALLGPPDAALQALVLLRPLACAVVDERPEHAAARGRAPAGDEEGSGPLADLASALDRLLLATGADAAELFLAAPTHGQLVLAAHRGRAPRAFRQVLAFERGQGFPGLVAQSGQPVLSLDLAHDDRYVRAMVKRQGFRSYLCVPVWGRSSFLGSLHIASRHSAEKIVPHLSFLTHAARHLGALVERHRLQAAEVVTRQPLDSGAGASANLRRTADGALRILVDVAGADCGAIFLCEGASGQLQPVSEWELPPRLHRTLARACAPGACPAIAQQRCVLPSDRSSADWPLCHAVQRDLATALCLPLEREGKPLGVAMLGCRHREALPTRHLSFLHEAVEHVAVLLHNAQVAIRGEREARALAGRAPDAGASAQTDAAAAPEAGVPFLELRCLGQFALTRDGRPLPPERFARRRALTLLKILLTRYGKRVHREELLELLWPDTEPQAASALLNVVVHNLRRGLEPAAPAGHPSSFIHTAGDYYAFDTRSPHRLDSQEFLETVRRGMACERQGQPAAALEAYQHALALYGGDFLEDERYSDWCALEREYLRESFLAALRRTAQLHLDQGEMDAAVACYRRALAADATLEDVHRALMETLWRAGRRDEALRQYRECRAILERELDIAPMPETERLRQRIATDAAPALR